MNRRIRLARALRGEWEHLSRSQQAPWLRAADRVMQSKGLSGMEEKPKRLVEDWRTVLKRSWSTRLAFVAPFALQAIWEVLSAAPPELRAFISFPIFTLLAALAILARVWNQS